MIEASVCLANEMVGGADRLRKDALAYSMMRMQEIAAACKGARPNHVGAAISRHKRAGRIEERREALRHAVEGGRSNARDLTPG